MVVSMQVTEHPERSAVAETGIAIDAIFMACQYNSNSVGNKEGDVTVGDAAGVLGRSVAEGSVDGLKAVLEDSHSERPWDLPPVKPIDPLLVAELASSMEISVGFAAEDNWLSSIVGDVVGMDMGST